LRLLVPASGPPPKLPPGGGFLPSRFPLQYADPAKSPLTATVERGKKNEFNFEVTKYVPQRTAGKCRSASSSVVADATELLAVSFSGIRFAAFSERASGIPAQE
jgi:hypothetical protein